MAKFKIGNKVKVLDGSNIVKYMDGWAMSEYVGLVGKIEKIIENERGVGYILEFNEKDNPEHTPKYLFDDESPRYVFDERGLRLCESDDRDEKLKEVETLFNKVLTELSKELSDLTNQLMEYELKKGGFPLFAKTIEDAENCPSWFVCSALFDLNRAKEFFEGGDDSE